MRIVAIDTTTSLGSLAIWEDGEVREETLLPAPDGFSALLFPALEALLQRHGLRPKDIDRWAGAAGPGTFTGIRIGLATVKGMAEAFGRSAHGISNLRALAWHGSGPLRAPMLDARRGDVYGALYDGSLQSTAPEIVIPRDSWLASVPAEAEFQIQELELFTSVLKGRPVKEVGMLAGAMADLASTEPPGDPLTVDANYVRRSDAELSLHPEPVRITSS